MLSAGVAGSVFASPPSSSILAAIRALSAHNPAGILVIVFNYTATLFSIMCSEHFVDVLCFQET